MNRSIKLNAHTITGLLALLMMLLSGCSFIRILNNSDAPITVLVRSPDSGKGYTRNLRPEQVVDVFSSYGGRYTVTVILTERYKQTLDDIRNTISERLFKERATLTGEEVTRLVNNLNQVEQLIDDLAKPGATCSGQLPDFDTVVVVAIWDTSLNDYEPIRKIERS